MYITWLEMKKALCSPVIWIVLLLMVAFNLFTIISESYYKDELKIVNDIIENYGPAFDDATLLNMEQDLEQQVVLMGGTSVDVFLTGMTYEKYAKLSLEEQQQIDKIGLMYTYIQVGKEVEARYTSIDINEIKEEFIKKQTMPSWLEKIMGKKFDNWQVRYDEIVATNEYKQWFFLKEYRMHSELFRSLIKTLALESVLIIVLLTALITNYEFEHRTQLVTYATKKGRKLVWHKGIASLICSFISICIVFSISLIAFFTVYDYSAVWQTTISSGMNWEYELPYITWWAIPLWLYLVLVICIITIVLLIISMLTFTISIFMKNSYFTWLFCVLFLLALFVVPSYFTNSTLQWLMHFNISLLLLNPHMYFSGGTTFMMTQYHEAWTVVVWFGIASISSLLAIRYFKSKDVN